MKLFVLFGQRVENYPGQYAPEALECIDEFGMEENPDWLEDKMKRARASNEYENLAIIPLEVDQSRIMQFLRPKAIEAIPAQVAPDPE